MLNVKNLKIIFLALLLTAAMPVLCMAGGKGHRHVKHGTRVNGGAHADTPGGGALYLVVQYLNPSNNPITINQIRVYKPDGTLASPNFAADSFPVPPFDLGPFESKGFTLLATGVQPVAMVPRGVFQVHADWESKKPTNGLKSTSIVVSVNPGVGVVGKIAIEGFDIKNNKSKDDDSSSND
jgi:hypothetical protein